MSSSLPLTKTARISTVFVRVRNEMGAYEEKDFKKNFEYRDDLVLGLEVIED